MGSDLLFIRKMLLDRVLANLIENTIINQKQEARTYSFCVY